MGGGARDGIKKKRLKRMILDSITQNNSDVYIFSIINWPRKEEETYRGL